MKNKNKSIFVAVYGTLMKGEHNHRWMREITAVKVADGLVGGSIRDTGYFPVAFLERDGGGLRKFAVEVYEVDAEDLAHLDILEGYPRLYIRESALVRTLWTERDELKVAFNAIIYIPANPMRWLHTTPIEPDANGVADWRVHRAKKEGKEVTI